MKYTLHSIEQLNQFAWQLLEQIGQTVAEKPVVLALVGPLGAGKTAFTKALGKALGIAEEEITSPTFVLHVPHRGKFEILNLKFEITLDHLDVWRIENWNEIERLGLAEMLQPRHLVVMEWADKFKPQVTSLKPQAEVVWITFAYGEDENQRVVEVDNE